MLNNAKNLISGLEETLKFESDKIEEIANIIIDSVKNGNKIMICGNGGSAAESQHFAAELIIRFKRERKSIPAISLTTDTSVLTACSNDYSFSQIFSRQIEGLAKSGDILILLTTSGNSENLVNAAKTAKELKCIVISFTGNKSNKLEGVSDFIIKSRSEETARIQEIQLFLIHNLADKVEAGLI
ncbi:SIS domain-containing protein [Candidatus Pacearchaeota archaeon]|nr:SIS domain-containing protein [Candidatus Pacearchaeota archaeon]